MVKCGLCGAEVKVQPKIAADGKCSVCGAKLATVSPSGKLGVVAGQKKK
jgi:ribosomal protein S27E